MVESEINEQNGEITLVWQIDTNAYKYYIYQKNENDTSFGNYIAELDGKINSFTTHIERNQKIEFMIEKDAWDYWAYGYIFAGYDIEPIHNKGRILLLCDNTIYSEIKENIDTLKYDLIGDGWIPNLELAPRSEQFNSDSVLKTKAIIDDYYKNYDDLKAVLLIGRVPVPYSGNFAVDGHSPEHQGAWPTDVFYSVMYGKWTDTISYTKADSIRNRNLPNDGKYDQLIIPNDAKLELGRIDFYNLPIFEISETELIKRYLRKNHLYRNAEIYTTDSTIVNDFFGLEYQEGFATSGWSNFTAISGYDMISEEKLRYSVREKSFLLAYGCGAGSYTSIDQTIYNDELVNYPFNAAFALLFGSYNGDWDSYNNVLRCALASEPFGLAVMWAGRPYWFLHHLAQGYNIGYSALLSQNSYPDVYLQINPYARRFNHIALLGDLSLRLHYLKPIESVSASKNDNNIIISWSKSQIDSILGYYIYRANSKFAKYELLNSTPISDTSFIDKTPLANENYYMVKVAKKKNTASGSYINTSTGKISNSIFYPILKENEFVRIFPNPTNKTVNFAFEKPIPNQNINIEIYDLLGNKINNFEMKIESDTNKIYSFDMLNKNGNTIASGVYFIQIRAENNTILHKIVQE